MKVNTGLVVPETVETMGLGRSRCQVCPSLLGCGYLSVGVPCQFAKGGVQGRLVMARPVVTLGIISHVDDEGGLPVLDERQEEVPQAMVVKRLMAIGQENGRGHAGREWNVDVSHLSPP
jgi:hypothetical protein